MSQTAARTQPALVRPCFAQDLEAVRLLLSHHALTGFSWLEEEPLSLAETQALWSGVVGSNLPFMVACPRADISRVVGIGFAREGLFGAPTLRGSPEVRIAVVPALMRHGVGIALLDSLLEDLKTFGRTHAYTAFGKTDPSPPARLLTRAGFVEMASLQGIARKFGRAFDVAIFGKAL